MPDWWARAGLLDAPAPLFAWADAAFAAIAGPTARLLIWAAIAAVVSMALYRLLSPQARIGRVKAEAVAARHALNAYDGAFEGAWPLIRRMLGLSLRQLGLVTGPAVLASLPVLCLIAWLSTAYGHAFPATTEAIDVRAYPEPSQARLVAPAAGDDDPRIVLVDDAGAVTESLPLVAPVTTIHKRQWWNALIGNPAGYLPDHVRPQRIEIDLPARQYLSVGPAWMRSWWAVFFTALIACSLAIKVAFRIE